MKIIKLIPVLFALVLSYVSFSQSHLRTYTPQKAMTESPENWEALPSSDVLIVTQYLDGLGRLRQEVIHKANGTKDLVQPADYDQYGRQAKTYLPYAIESNGGKFRPNALQEQQSFYNSKFENQGAYAHSLSIFDNSPLDQVLESYGPGKNWQVNEKSRKVETRTNSASDQIPIFDGTAFQGYYADGMLRVVESRDEDDNLSVSYTGKRGQTLLTKRQIDGTWAETYTIYDDFLNPIYVVPPEAMAYLRSHNWVWNSTEMAKWVYHYKYDKFKRQIEKTLPGKAVEYAVYDHLHRLVLVQDGELRSQGQWLYTQYDIWSRPTKTALLRAGSRESLATAFETPRYALPLTASDILTYTYYDTYDFTSRAFTSAYNSYLKNNHDLATDNLTGIGIKMLSTGSRVRILGSDDFLETMLFLRQQAAAGAGA